MKPGIPFIIFLIMLTSLCDTINQMFLKSAINSFSGSCLRDIRGIFSFIAKIIMAPRVWIGFIFAFLSLCIWLFVLSRADLNLAFSLDSMHYLFIAASSRLILKERVGPQRWTGTVLIVLGIILVSLS